MEDGDAIDVFEEQIGGAEPFNLTVSDARAQYELAFKVKPTTQLGKVMNVFAEKQGYMAGDPPRRTCRFLFNGTTVHDADSPESVSEIF